MARNRQKQHASKIDSINRKFHQLKFRIFDPRCLGRPQQSLLPWVSHT